MRSAVIRSVCAASIGMGAAAAVADAVAAEPLPVLPVASGMVAVGSAVLAVHLRRTSRLCLSASLIWCASVIVCFGRLCGVEGRWHTLLLGAGVLLLAAVCAVLGRPEVVRLVTQTKARAVIRFQEFHAARIADELHDEVVQALALTSRRLDSAANQDDPGEMSRSLRDAVGVLNEQVSVLRSVISNLHPVASRHVGLAAGTRMLAGQVAAANGLVIDVEVPEGPALDDRVDGEIVTTAYRIVQEALANVVKHADATRAAVSLRCRRGQLLITVVDDGSGLSASRAGETGGYGLESIRWRCEVYRGDFTIDDREGGGTRLRAALPLSQAAASHRRRRHGVSKSRKPVDSR